MNSEIMLRGVDSNLKLDAVINEHGWTRCYFEKGQERIYLGAETVGFIVTCLMDALTQGRKEKLPSQALDLAGEKVRGVLVLSERHHALYATFDNEEQKFFWQDAQSESLCISGVMTVGPGHKKEWLKQLGVLKDKWSQTPQWNYTTRSGKTSI